jgi:hypothetical protein
MNASVYSADRATYLRIVIVTLLASIAIVGLAISARIGNNRSAQATNGRANWKAELPNRNAAVGLPSRLTDLIRPHSRGKGEVDTDRHARGVAA